MVSKKEKKSSALNEKKGIEQPPTLSTTAAEKLKIQRQKRHSIDTLVQGIIDGNKTALSRAITIIESTAVKHQSEAKELVKRCLPYANKSTRIGITGVPGVGKSTFIEQFGLSLTHRGKKVAVLAVDPSSSVSKGSILGDKTRMDSLVKEAHAFIRPSASGDSLGGVARKTREAIILCEAAGYDHIIIETVGVGQSETVVHSMTDFFLLLKLAGAGDELQGIKRGIIEMADAIVINKADGENIRAAKIAKTEFNRALHLYPPKANGWTAKTMTSSAINNEGVQEVSKMISNFISEMKRGQHFQQKRIEQHKFWLLQTVESRLKSDFYSNKTVKKELKLQLEKIEANKTTPFEAADYLLGLL